MDESFYNELRTIKEECVIISRQEVDRFTPEKQVEVLNKLTDFVEKLQEAFGIIGIDIKVKAK